MMMVHTGLVHTGTSMNSASVHHDSDCGYSDPAIGIIPLSDSDVGNPSPKSESGRHDPKVSHAQEKTD